MSLSLSRPHAGVKCGTGHATIQLYANAPSLTRHHVLNGEGMIFYAGRLTLSNNRKIKARLWYYISHVLVMAAMPGSIPTCHFSVGLCIAAGDLIGPMCYSIGLFHFTIWWETGSAMQRFLSSVHATHEPVFSNLFIYIWQR